MMLQRCSAGTPPSPGPKPSPGPPVPIFEARLPLATWPPVGMTAPRSTSARLWPASTATSSMAPGVCWTEGSSKSPAASSLFEAMAAASAPATSIFSVEPGVPSGLPPPPPKTSMIWSGALTRDAYAWVET